MTAEYRRTLHSLQYRRARAAIKKASILEYSTGIIVLFFVIMYCRQKPTCTSWYKQTSTTRTSTSGTSTVFSSLTALSILNRQSSDKFCKYSGKVASLAYIDKVLYIQWDEASVMLKPQQLTSIKHALYSKSATAYCDCTCVITAALVQVAV